MLKPEPLIRLVYKPDFDMREFISGSTEAVVDDD